jgi:3-phosphoshikimate 1-carboxyvinyltransferase
MALPDILPIQPFTRPARGIVTPPGSKSLTNRALLLAALCDRPVTLNGALDSEDTRLMAEALRQLGYKVDASDGATTLRVSGQDKAFPDSSAKLEVGLAGTAARFLTALCAAAPRGTWQIDGTPQMRRRPMRGLIDALRALGADIRCLGGDGFLPVEVRSHGLNGGSVTVDARESSQLLSALLMVAPRASGPVEVAVADNAVRASFAEMTLSMMRRFGLEGVSMQKDPMRFRVTPQRAYACTGDTFSVEGDASSASYFVALPLVAGGSLEIPGYGIDRPLQGDTAFAMLLEQSGLIAPLSRNATGQVFSAGPSRKGIDANFREFSDTFLTLAAIAPLLKGPTRITGIAHTRRQETDRIAGMAAELRKLGQEVAEEDGALTITPRPLRAGVTVYSHGDHRFAMSFAILGCHDLNGDGSPWLSIKDPACCAKTYPTFFDVLENLRKNSAAEKANR